MTPSTIQAKFVSRISIAGPRTHIVVPAADVPRLIHLRGTPLLVTIEPVLHRVPSES